MAKGKLVIMGSGETAPGMTKVHRELLSGLGEVRAVNLDTPYGFQLNVPQMTQKLVDYFKVSLQTDLKPLSFTNYEKPSGVERELFRQSVREANYIFAGPGSPSYALAQWKGLDLQEDLLHVLDNGGVVCFSSAAALTLGAFTAPIYEIYKAGAEPYWIEALNLLEVAGLNCVVIPHFDNKEGENYDTSCCYLGLRRLEILESMLEEGTATLGIDEHTAVIIDLDNGTLSVQGRGNAHWRNNGSVLTLENDAIVPLLQLQQSEVVTKSEVIEFLIVPSSPLELAEAVNANPGNSVEFLAKLVQLAQTGGEGFIDPAPMVEGILSVRINARKNCNYELADKLRNILKDSGIEIYDSASGTTWEITT
jgi:cyanophycinase-like exopeptidase